MYYDNEVAIYITSNDMFHERTKHIEVDYHFIREAIMKEGTGHPYVKSNK